MFCCSLRAQPIPYLSYCENVAQHHLSNLDSFTAIWEDRNIVSSRSEFNPSDQEIYLAALCANLFEITGKEFYLDKLQTILWEYGRYRLGFPLDSFQWRVEYQGGLPAIPSFFALPKYIHAYVILSRHRQLDTGVSKTIENFIAESADFMLTTQEWGPMNRAMLRAEGLLYASKALREHPHRRFWESMGKTILEDNLSNWSIEDSGMYQIIWLYSLAGYCAYISEDFSPMKTPLIRYYFDYFKVLLSPAGVIPDFGDANWRSRWFNYISHFELGAACNLDPELKWAAQSIFIKNREKQPNSLLAAMVLSDACRWGDFTLPQRMPVAGSQEGLEDQIGKKVVFRDGWGDDATYLLLNYKDEGEHGWMFKENLKTTLTVEEEKMHHGHSDENSIVLLMDDQSVLLHDGGYRTLLPSGPLGAFRADYFHNRLIVRNRKIDTGQDRSAFKYNTRDQVSGQRLLSFLSHSGAHEPVESYKVEFSKFDDYEVFRSRVVNINSGYESDRVVNYLKSLNIFVIFDVVRYLREGYYTAATMWYSGNIADSGVGWYDTKYDSLNREKLSGEKRLCIYFPDTDHTKIGVDSIMRYYQPEYLMYQLKSGHAYPQRIEVFTTILIPHHPIEPVTGLINGMNVIAGPHTVTCTINKDSVDYIIGAKTDLTADFFREWQRPKYNWATGKQDFGVFTTDASHFYAAVKSDECHVAGTNLTKILFHQRPIFEQAPVTNEFNFDGSEPESGIWRVRSWQGTMKLKD